MIPSHSCGAQQGEQRPQPFAAGLEQVRRRGRDELVVVVDGGVQQSVDPLEAIGQVLGQLRGHAGQREHRERSRSSQEQRRLVGDLEHGRGRDPQDQGEQ